jgi:hypothetical protein
VLWVEFSHCRVILGCSNSRLDSPGSDAGKLITEMNETESLGTVASVSLCQALMMHMERWWEDHRHRNDEDTA